jgi:hypothetical protein
VHRIKVIFLSDFRQLRQTKAFLIVCLLLGAFTAIAAAILGVTLRKMEFLPTTEAAPILELITGLVSYFMPLLVLMTFIWSFFNLTILKEKIDGSLQSLLATPIRPWELWIAKSMAIFVPGYLFAAISTLILLWTINLTAAMPFLGYYIMPASLMWLGFIVNPLLLLAIQLLVVMLSLINNPDIGIAPTFLVGFGLMMGIPLGIATKVIDLASRTFCLYYLLAAVVLLAVNLFLCLLLTKENIILSGKGS